MQALHHLCAQRVNTIEDCRHCPWRGFCQGACPASAFLETGTLLATDGLCELRRTLYRETFFDLVPRSEPGKF
jgi:sulfatase maturation enzyme AslB (radical SAM superfamily)